VLKLHMLLLISSVLLTASAFCGLVMAGLSVPAPCDTKQQNPIM
jgi:hypothetical protein